ncbi:MAG: hypothetical protein KAR35_05875 [Candidatus Heimdallarchaeota archaeon]|nr:hypothetical protein [Candidatus Heimdallarchaeota archaeon]MCK5048887.1 hypothetical protein [Candidatus Heimdallarchaeota archaeon]
MWAEAIKNGISWILSQETVDGGWSEIPRGPPNNASLQSVGKLVQSELIKLTDEQIRKASTVVISAQFEDGSIPYYLNERSAGVQSTTLALNGYFDICPEEMRDVLFVSKAIQFITRHQEKDGKFIEKIRINPQGGIAETAISRSLVTALALLPLQKYYGLKDNISLIRAYEMLIIDFKKFMANKLPEYEFYRSRIVLEVISEWFSEQTEYQSLLAARIAQLQRSDGSWVFKKMNAAFSTPIAVAMLELSNVGTNDPMLQKAFHYLINNQAPEGFWRTGSPKNSLPSLSLTAEILLLLNHK